MGLCLCSIMIAVYGYFLIRLELEQIVKFVFHKRIVIICLIICISLGFGILMTSFTDFGKDDSHFARVKIYKAFYSTIGVTLVINIIIATISLCVVDHCITRFTSFRDQTIVTYTPLANNVSTKAKMQLFLGVIGFPSVVTFGFMFGFIKKIRYPNNGNDDENKIPKYLLFLHSAGQAGWPIFAAILIFLYWMVNPGGYKYLKQKYQEWQRSRNQEDIDSTNTDIINNVENDGYASASRDEKNEMTQMNGDIDNLVQDVDLTNINSRMCNDTTSTVNEETTFATCVSQDKHDHECCRDSVKIIPQIESSTMWTHDQPIVYSKSQTLAKVSMFAIMMMIRILIIAANRVVLILIQHQSRQLMAARLATFYNNPILVSIN